MYECAPKMTTPKRNTLDRNTPDISSSNPPNLGKHHDHDSALDLRNVTFSYGGVPVLNGIDFFMPCGQMAALVGPNGSGKSTLIKLVLGLLTPQLGEIRILGEPSRRLRRKFRIGYVPQRTPVDQSLSATVEEVVATGRLARRGWWRRFSATDRESIREAMEAVDLLERRHSRVANLSGGQQQRVLIARALAGGPELLILDEPTTGVDVESQEHFRDILVAFRNSGGTVLLVSHELRAVANDLDRVVVLRRGVMEFDGPPADLEATGVSLGVHEADLPVWLEGDPQ